MAGEDSINAPHQWSQSETLELFQLSRIEKIPPNLLIMLLQFINFSSPLSHPHFFPPSPIQWYRGVRTLGRYIHGIPSTHLHLYLALPCFVNTATYPRLRLCSRSIVEKYKSYRQRCYISADGLSGLCQNSRPSKYHPPPPPLKLRFQPRISSASLNISTKN